MPVVCHIGLQQACLRSPIYATVVREHTPMLNGSVEASQFRVYRCCEWGSAEDPKSIEVRCPEEMLTSSLNSVDQTRHIQSGPLLSRQQLFVILLEP